MVRTKGAWVADEATGDVGVIVGRKRWLMVIEGTSRDGDGRPLLIQWLANPLLLRLATTVEKMRFAQPVRVWS